MDDEGSDGMMYHHIATTNNVEISGKSEDGDHKAVFDPDQLTGPQVIDIVMNKPEFSFLIRYYNLLYQSLIPNCKLTISTLRRYISISDAIERYIVSAGTHRISCQRLINFLLTCLHSDNDYKQFCYLLKIISVTDLYSTLITEFESKGSLEFTLPVHSTSSDHKLQHYDRHINKCMTMDSSSAAVDAVKMDDNDDEASGGRANKCSVRKCLSRNSRRRFVGSQATNASSSKKLHHSVAKKSVAVSANIDTMDLSFLLCPSGWRIVGEWFDSLCDAITQNYQLTTGRLKAMPQLLTDGVDLKQLNQLISLSSSVDVKKINEKIITYLIIKLCYTAVNGAPQTLPVTSVLQSSSMEYSQSNILSQPSSPVTIISDTHNTFSSSSVVTTGIVIEHFTTSSSLVSSFSGSLVTSTFTISPGIASPISTAKDGEPQILLTNKDFAQVKAHYHTILRLMPDDYILTIGKLQDYINDDQICAILSCTNHTIANKMILDCLIERMSCREDLLDLCAQLEGVTSSHDLKIIIKELRHGISLTLTKPAVVTSTVPSSVNSAFSESGDTTTVSGASSASNFESQSFRSKQDLQVDVQYKERHLQKGFKYIKPPPLPSNHIDRQSLLDEIVSKLLQDTNDPNKFKTTVTITGAGGFGKTTCVTSLCYQSVVKQHFTDGFLFINLGPQATDPLIKLRALYQLLSDEQCDINIAEQKVHQLTSDFYRNLLVIIDDVWNVEDAEPFVKAFSACKIILTTRLNNIEQYIPSNQSVIVGPMTQNEAISVLTSGVIDINKLSQEDVILLNKIAQNVFLWPLLLSLIRGQLFHNIEKSHMSYDQGIQNVQYKLHQKGLKAFDKNNIEAVKTAVKASKTSRNLAVKACIEISLELLAKPISDKMKILILWTGIGTSLQKAVLNILWSVSKQEAEDTIDVLWTHGLVQYTGTSNNNTQYCVEVHAVISQYIIECIDSEEAQVLSAYGHLNTTVLVQNALHFEGQLKAVSHLSSPPLSTVDFLQYTLHEIEEFKLPFNFKKINTYIVNEPHQVILALKGIKVILTRSINSKNLLSLFDKEIDSLIDRCKVILRKTHELSRKINQSVQRNLCEKAYDKLIETVQEFMKSFPLCDVASSVVSMVKKIMTRDQELQNNEYIIEYCEALQMMTTEYHTITTLILPNIKYHVRMHKLITNSLQSGSPDIELIAEDLTSGKYNEEIDLVETNHLIKIQEVAPNYVRNQLLKRQH